jgi:antirestriction protein ArdC
MDKTKIYENITAKIIAGLEEAGSWSKLWKTSSPCSLAGHEYRGINRLILNSSQYKSNVWGSFKQIKDWGGVVRKGERGHHVVFWQIKTYLKPGEDESKAKTFFMERWYYVFNTDQADFDGRGIMRIEKLGAQQKNNMKITSAEDIIASIPYEIEIEHKSGIAAPCYIPSLDKIRIYPMGEFHSSNDYYSVLFHELVHSTGHEKRLNRTDWTPFGSHEYSKEELVAEMGAAFMCGLADIEPNIRSSAAYIASWSTKLKSNPEWLMQAVSKAKKAVEYLVPESVYAEAEEVEA